MHALHASSRALMAFVDEALAQSTLEAGELKLRGEVVELAPLFDEVLSAFRETVAQKWLRLDA